jgi:manganese transport protein
MFAFAGPAYLVSVGYMDPGNWASDLAGGAQFGYRLLWVLVLSNAMAILLQTLSARLGIAARRDLAQACRESYPRPVSFALWVLCEVAIAACDLAEVLGAAIGLKLLFGLPLLAGVLLTAFDTLFLLWFSRFGIRVVEGLVLALITVIAGAFGYEILLARPNMGEIALGLIPWLDNSSLYIAISILGATVMPHNLYLHSALVQTRDIGPSDAEKRSACRYNLFDSVLALNGALFVNASILIVAASVFFKRGIIVTEIEQAHQLLAPLLGASLASVAFGVALLCSGQSSTLTGTMAGQIVMEGFLNFRMRPWLRRLITRTLAIVPAALTIWFAGEAGTYRLIILSQVVLSLQLPFAVIPLIHFTSGKSRMGAFANRLGWQVVCWCVATVIVVLNAWLTTVTLSEWLAAAGAWRTPLLIIVVPMLLGVGALLAWITLDPWLARWVGRFGKASVAMPAAVASDLAVPTYKRILVPLDHSIRDRDAITHAAALARQHGARLYLLHVEEGVTSQVYGEMASTAEVIAGRRYLDGIVEALRAQNVDCEAAVAHANDAKSAIVEYSRHLEPDLLVMGAHGHRGIKDLVFGTTINAVRHELHVPVLVVRTDRPATV